MMNQAPFLNSNVACHFAWEEFEIMIHCSFQRTWAFSIGDKARNTVEIWITFRQLCCHIAIQLC